MAEEKKKKGVNVEESILKIIHQFHNETELYLWLHQTKKSYWISKMPTIVVINLKTSYESKSNLFLLEVLISS